MLSTWFIMNNNNSRKSFRGTLSSEEWAKKTFFFLRSCQYKRKRRDGGGREPCNFKPNSWAWQNFSYKRQRAPTWIVRRRAPRCLNNSFSVAFQWLERQHCLVTYQSLWYLFETRPDKCENQRRKHAPGGRKLNSLSRLLVNIQSDAFTQFVNKHFSMFVEIYQSVPNVCWRISCKR